MSDTKKENLRFISSLIGTICLTILVPLIGLNMKMQMSVMREVAEINTRVSIIEAWRDIGERYTREDAVRDFGPVVEKINGNGLAINDLEDELEELEDLIYEKH